MKKFVCLLLMTALVLGCVSAASASISATYSNGKIYVTNSGSGMTRVNMNGASTGYVLDSNHTTVVLTPPAGATSVTISGVTDPFFGGDGGSVTILGSASRPIQREMLREISTLGDGVEVIDTYLSRFGLRVWESR